MKSLLLLFMCALLNLFCSAQTFQKIFGDTIAEEGAYFISPDNSNFYLLTSGQYYMSPSHLSIIKTNEVGDSLNSVGILGSYSTYGVYCANCENEFVFVSWKDAMIAPDQFQDTIYIYRVDTAGATLSSWSYPDTLSLVNLRIMHTSDGGYLLSAGYWNSQFDANILFMKIDSSGTVQWKISTLPYSQSQEAPIDLMETSDHYYIAEIVQSSGSNWAGPKVMMKLDTLGNVVWTTMLTGGYSGGAIQQMVATDSGYIYVDNTGYSQSSIYNSRINFVDTDGNLQWSKTFYNENLRYYSIQPKNSGGYYLCGVLKLGTTTERSIIFTSLDDNADSISSFTLGFNPGYEYPEYFKQFTDGRIGIIGTTRPSFYSNLLENNIYFAVCDTLGNVTAIQDLSRGSNDGAIVYPNPTTGQFTISELKFAIKDLEIFNSLGKKVYSESMNTYSKTFNINLAKGIYFVRVSNGGKSSVKKLVVE